MKLIPLSRNKFAKVSDKDYSYLRKNFGPWSAQPSRKRGKFYAIGRWKRGPFKGKPLSLHRAVMRAKPGDPKVDHVDGDPQNDMKSNLRWCSDGENQRNRCKPASNNKTSKHIGVRRLPDGRWLAYITKNYKTHYLGIFRFYTCAVKAREAGELRHYGKFACKRKAAK